MTYLTRTLLGIILIFLSGCTSPDVVKIGLIAPFEGTHRDIGYDAIYAARLAVREINQNGGIHGTRVSLVALDDSGSSDFALKNGQALMLDPAIVAIVGHGLDDTTELMLEGYAAADLPFIPLSLPPFAPFPAANLPADFAARYEAVTPFDETPGPFAAPTYDAFQLIFVAMGEAQAAEGEITRDSLKNHLPKSTHQGITGTVNWP